MISPFSCAVMTAQELFCYLSFKERNRGRERQTLHRLRRGEQFQLTGQLQHTHADPPRMPLQRGDRCLHRFPRADQRRAVHDAPVRVPLDMQQRDRSFLHCDPAAFLFTASDPRSIPPEFPRPTDGEDTVLILLSSWIQNSAPFFINSIRFTCRMPLRFCSK